MQFDKDFFITPPNVKYVTFNTTLPTSRKNKDANRMNIVDDDAAAAAAVSLPPDLEIQGDAHQLPWQAFPYFQQIKNSLAANRQGNFGNACRLKTNKLNEKINCFFCNFQQTPSFQ